MNAPVSRIGMTIDYDLHMRAKIRSVELGMSMTKFIESALRNELDRTTAEESTKTEKE